MSKISDLSGNAVLAKARAMYADCLTREDYRALVSCRTVNEIASYLKSHTRYGDDPIFASASGYSRARLEAQLRRSAYGRVLSLASFEKAIGQQLYKIIYINYDISLILACADHLESNVISDTSLFVPEKIKKKSSLDAASLERASNFSELYEALDGTEYQRLLDIFRVGTVSFSIPSLENVLYRYMCDEIKKNVKKNFSGESRNEILGLFRMKSDFKMLESIYRMKRYFPNEPLDITKIFFSGLSAFSVAEINDMLSSQSEQEIFSLFTHSEYGKYFDAEYTDNIEKSTHIAEQTALIKKLRFSVVPEVVMFCYIGILENEVRNIIHITECVRYALPPEETENFLVFGKTE